MNIKTLKHETYHSLVDYPGWKSRACRLGVTCTPIWGQEAVKYAASGGSFVVASWSAGQLPVFMAKGRVNHNPIVVWREVSRSTKEEEKSRESLKFAIDDRRVGLHQLSFSSPCPT